MSGKTFIRLAAPVTSFGPCAEEDSFLHVALFACCGLLITLLVAVAVPGWFSAATLLRLE
jgi:hypothetical protein